MEIGIFIKSGEEFRGTIRTLTFSAEIIFSPKHVYLRKIKTSHRIFANGCEVGAAWPKTPGNVSEFIVRLDDPTFPGTHSWSFGRTRNGRIRIDLETAELENLTVK